MGLEIHVQLDYWFEQACDILLQVEVAATSEQVIEHAQITLPQNESCVRVVAQDGIGERLWLRIQGQMLVDYRATISIDRPVNDVAVLPATPLLQLPGEAVQYLVPSRYCPSHQFGDFIEKEFGDLEGGAKIVAMRDWISDNLSYVPGSSDADTTAADTFHDRKGICRDYAHLMITLARAGDIPARIASVYAAGVSPPDFHAVAEIFLGGAWHLVDPTGMAEERETAVIGVGRDIGDVAFLTAFGSLVMNGQNVSVTSR